MQRRGVWWLAVALLARPLAARADAPAVLTLDLSALGDLPERQLTAMAAEADGIWRSHGVHLRWTRAPEPPGAAGVRLAVVPARDGALRRGPLAAGEGLGAVTFTGGATEAEPVLYLSVETIRRAVMNAPVHGRFVHAWPPRSADDLVGRALGRVLAHEIGHYLLALRGHTPAGLMRESFSPDVLTASRGGELTVAPILLPRLRARLAELSGTGEAAPPVTEK